MIDAILAGACADDDGRDRARVGRASVPSRDRGVAAGCRRGGGERPAAQGDRLVTAMISDPKTFNPLLSVDTASIEARRTTSSTGWCA